MVQDSATVMRDDFDPPGGKPGGGSAAWVDLHGLALNKCVAHDYQQFNGISHEEM